MVVSLKRVWEAAWTEKVSAKESVLSKCFLPSCRS